MINSFNFVQDLAVWGIFGVGWGGDLSHASNWLIASWLLQTYGGSDYSEVTANCAIHIVEVRGTWLPCYVGVEQYWGGVIRKTCWEGVSGVLDVITMLKKKKGDYARSRFTGHTEYIQVCLFCTWPCSTYDRSTCNMITEKYK